MGKLSNEDIMLNQKISECKNKLLLTDTLYDDKADALEAAIELGYDDSILSSILTCTTAVEIDRTLKTVRTKTA